MTLSMRRLSPSSSSNKRKTHHCHWIRRDPQVFKCLLFMKRTLPKGEPTSRPVHDKEENKSLPLKK